MNFLIAIQNILILAPTPVLIYAKIRVMKAMVLLARFIHLIMMPDTTQQQVMPNRQQAGEPENLNMALSNFSTAYQRN